MSSCFFKGHFNGPTLHKVQDSGETGLLLIGRKIRPCISLSQWITGEDPSDRERGLSSTVPQCCSTAPFDLLLALPVPLNPGGVPGRMRIIEHLVKLRKACSNQTWPPHLAWLTRGRWCIETGIKAQWGDEGDLLFSADRSQLDDAVRAITDEFDSTIGKPSTYQLHELFCPVWNRFVSAS